MPKLYELIEKSAYVFGTSDAFWEIINGNVMVDGKVEKNGYRKINGDENITLDGLKVFVWKDD